MGCIFIEILAGIALLSLVSIFFMFSPSTITCTIRRLLLGFAFAMIFAPLFVKVSEWSRYLLIETSCYLVGMHLAFSLAIEREKGAFSRSETTATTSIDCRSSTILYITCNGADPTIDWYRMVTTRIANRIGT